MRKNIIFIGLFLLMFFMGLGSVQAETVEINKSDLEYAVVTSDTADVMFRPSEDSVCSQTIIQGKKVRILSREDDWYRVRVNGGVGYVKKEYLTETVIVVDISDQVLYFYKNGKNILTARVITGLLGKNDTPIGKYEVKKNNMLTNVTLRGRNNDGTKYKAPVKYWIPFVEGKIGFHDASWRTAAEYTKEAYKTNGSHGCVNMKKGKAKKLYESIKEDTMVIVRD